MTAATEIDAGFDVLADGPAEADWRSRIAELPVWPVAPDLHVVVVAPHPDDETLGVGGTLQLLVAIGARIDLVAVTDGEASHPARADLGAHRRGELRTALHRSGIVAATTVHHLGVPDGRVATHQRRVRDAVVALATSRSLLLAPVLDDGHPDHEAVARAAVAAADVTGASVLTFPVWAWQGHDPATTRLLAHAWRVPLWPQVLARKRHAVDAFDSQVSARFGPPIVPPHVLTRLLRDDEVLVVPCA